MKQTVGTCGVCGGEVTVPTVYWSVIPPKPTCEQCGAVISAGPVLPMRPAPQYRTTDLYLEDNSGDGHRRVNISLTPEAHETGKALAKQNNRNFSSFLEILIEHEATRQAKGTQP